MIEEYDILVERARQLVLEVSEVTKGYTYCSGLRGKLCFRADP